MNQEEIRNQEMERIVHLINLWRPHNDFGTSLQVGKLINAIRGKDEEFREWLEKDAMRQAKRDKFLREIGFDDFDTGYEKRHESRVEDPTTDLWGGAGPDCRSVPA